MYLKQESEALLEQCGAVNGLFLIRRSTRSADVLTLDICFERRTQHYIIKHFVSLTVLLFSLPATIILFEHSKTWFFLEMNLFMVQINLQNNQGSIFICHLDCCILGTPALDGSIHICRLLFSWVGFLRYLPNMIKMSLSIKLYFCQIRGNICIYHKTSKFVVTFLAFVLHVCLE